MSINWVMLDPSKGFVRLPGEEIIFKSPPKTSLSITTPRAYPANIPLSLQSNAGNVYLTNQRAVYLPTPPSKDLQSFSAPLLNLHDTHVVLPWFGANSWQAVLQPVPGGNIPAGHVKIEVRLTFNEGGATEFHSNFERIKERLQQVVESARAGGFGSGGAPLSGVNLDSVHLDQLPTYEASGQDPIAPAAREHQQARPAAMPRRTDSGSIQPPEGPPPGRSAPEAPREAPPGYEETQQQSLQAEFERRLSGQS